MRLWNGAVMYAPRTPDFYALPGTDHCIFRLMHKYGDVQAWNLYWLTKPETDLIPPNRDNWHAHYHSFTGAQTRSFYESLDTIVFNRLTLGMIVSRPPREALRLLALANLERTSFYRLIDGEAWRSTMLGRLFFAERLGEERRPQTEDGVVVVADFILQRYTRLGSHEYKQLKRPA